MAEINSITRENVMCRPSKKMIIPTSPSDYEECNRCGYDHEYNPTFSALFHSNCELCQLEVSKIGIGNGPDHKCEDHQV